LSYNLSKNPKVRYSESERQLFSILPKSSMVDSKTLMENFYKGQKQPYHGRPAIISRLRSLKKKMRLNGEPFMIVNSKRAGPKAMSFGLKKKANGR
jgi:hypothetical protein